MAIGSAIYGILSNNSDIASAVSTRIYPNIVPQSHSYPCITYQVTGVTPNETKDYVNIWDEHSIVVTVYSNTYATTETIAGYVKTAMERYSGSVGSETVITCRWEGYDDSVADDMALTGATSGSAVYMKSINMTLITR